MKFFQRGRGQAQSSRRVERDTQLVLAERIADLNSTINYLTTQIDYENRYFSDRHRLGRTGIGRLEGQRSAAIRKRDQAMQQLMAAPAIHAPIFGTNAASAGGRKTRRKRRGRKRRRTRRRH